MHGSMRIGNAVARLQNMAMPAWLERDQVAPRQEQNLVQISMD
jgi:hypothetical protein